MSDPNPPPEQQPPQVLSYDASPSPPSGGQILFRTFLFLLGTAGGVVCIGFLGFAVWSAAGYDYNHSPTFRPLWPIIIFFVLFIGALAASFFIFRRFRRAAKWLLLGLLIAAGLASMGEGYCFLTQ